MKASAASRASASPISPRSFRSAIARKDYLLGRLHAVDRLIDIVCDSAGAGSTDRIDVTALKQRAFTHVLDAEEKHLGQSAELIAALRRCVAEMATGRGG